LTCQTLEEVRGPAKQFPHPRFLLSALDVVVHRNCVITIVHDEAKALFGGNLPHGTTCAILVRPQGSMASSETSLSHSSSKTRQYQGHLWSFVYDLVYGFGCGAKRNVYRTRWKHMGISNVPGRLSALVDIGTKNVESGYKVTLNC
jgi:hypothetical protein